MPPKAAADKKPAGTAGKAPAGKAPAEKKEAGKKTAAASGDKKKRNKTRKETYSSYIYKGTIAATDACLPLWRVFCLVLSHLFIVGLWPMAYSYVAPSHVVHLESNILTRL